MGKWLDEPKHLLFEVKDRIAYVTLNRPEKRNAQSFEALQELNRAMLEADDLKEVRVVVIQGAGKDFCAGADVGSGTMQVGGSSDYDPTQYRERDSYDNDIWLTQRGSELRLILCDMHKPVIAKVHGNCLAVGSDIALNCDFIIAADSARFGFPATRALGSPTNQMWLYHIGPQWTKRLLMTGDLITGADAQRVGLVLKAVPEDDLDAEVDRLAKRIAIADPALQAAHKRIVNLGLDLMGRQLLQRLAVENDVRAHQADAFQEFFDVSAREGFKEALRRRDAPYGDLTGDPRADSIIRLDD